jgi:hypothetical protein
LIGLYNTRVLAQEGFEQKNDDSITDKKDEKKASVPTQVSPENIVKAVSHNNDSAVVYPSDNTQGVDDNSSSVSTPQEVEVEVENVDTTTTTTEGFTSMGKQKNTMNAMLNTYKQMIPKQSNSLVFYKMPGSKETGAFEGFSNSSTSQY